MSGRKVSDVISVLKGMAEIREFRLKRELEAIERGLSGLADYDIDDDVVIPNLTAEQQQLLQQGLELLRTQMQQSKHEVAQSLESYQKVSQALVEKTKALEKRLQEREGDFDYFDSEYEEAVGIRQEYQNFLESYVTPLKLQIKSIVSRTKEEHEGLCQQSETLARRNAKEDVEAFRSQIEKTEFRHPVNGKPIRCADFIELFGVGCEQHEQLLSTLEAAGVCVDADDYESCKARLKEAEYCWTQLSQVLNSTEEQLAEQVTTASALQDALEASGGTVEVQYVDGKLANGIRLVTVQTAHSVEFMVHQSDDAEQGQATQVTFNIDGWGENCQENRQKLQQKLKRHGVHVELRGAVQQPVQPVRTGEKEKDRNQQQ